MTARREIHRNWKWKLGHNPHDDDAHPDSGWLYAKIDPDTSTPPGFQITGRSGPPAGTKCMVHTSCQAEMYVVEGIEPREILQHLPGDVVIPKVEDRILILVCSNGHKTQCRESLLPARQQALRGR
ncbi:MAG: hypothetical protein A2Y74_06985 [Actinobacteria bacterium RBG_13_63_9]|nr:MAG: hypothetical protein A2Y74_06985 [Actinobacteria bacterium RBG_13_63_9]